MTPHIFKSIMPGRSGQWVCSNKMLSLYYPRVYYLVGDVYYGRTPLEAYFNWSKENDMGSD